MEHRAGFAQGRRAESAANGREGTKNSALYAKYNREVKSTNTFGLDSAGADQAKKNAATVAAAEAAMAADGYNPATPASASASAPAPAPVAAALSSVPKAVKKSKRRLELDKLGGEQPEAPQTESDLAPSSHPSTNCSRLLPHDVAVCVFACRAEVGGCDGGLSQARFR